MKIISINQVCVLNVSGFDISFNFTRVDRAGVADLVVVLSMKKELGNLTISSIPTYTSIVDMRKLATYFENHIARLQNDSSYYEAFVFLNNYLGFEIQALDGEIASESDGSFTIRVMVNVGEAGELQDRVYVGAESVIFLEDINNFIREIRSLADQFDANMTAV